MAYEMKPNTGSLFKNDRKEADSHPDYKGTALIEGLGECWLDAWINTSKSGDKYMSVKIKQKEQRGPAGGPSGDSSNSFPRQAPAFSEEDDLDDGIPF